MHPFQIKVLITIKKHTDPKHFNSSVYAKKLSKFMKCFYYCIVFVHFDGYILNILSLPGCLCCGSAEPLFQYLQVGLVSGWVYGFLRQEISVFIDRLTSSDLEGLCFPAAVSSSFSESEDDEEEDEGTCVCWELCSSFSWRSTFLSSSSLLCLFSSGDDGNIGQHLLTKQWHGGMEDRLWWLHRWHGNSKQFMVPQWETLEQHGRDE